MNGTQYSARIRYGVVFTCLAAINLGCLMIDGDRASSGVCPPDETCSPATPDGLTFIGLGYFDDETARLGPIVAGGTLDVGIVANGVRLPEFDVEIEDPSVLSSRDGEGTFGPTDEDGQPRSTVEAFVSLRALRVGTTYIRLVDPATRALFDRVAFTVHEITDIRLRNLSGTDRDALRPGENDLIGIRIVSSQSDRELRLIDKDLEFSADGEVQPENMYWDCFTYEVPADRSEAQFTIRTGGRTYHRTMPIR